MARLNAAVIGLGVGQGHIATYRMLGADVTAICDTNESLLEKVGDEFDVEQRYTDYRSIAERSDIDVVSICTPDHIHTEPAVQMMESGKHVMVEKPLATSFDDLRLISETAKRTGVKLTHGCQIRFSPTYQEIKKQVAAGDFGEIFYAEADYISTHLNLFTDGWRGDLGAEYNPVAGGGVHPIDVIQWIVDSPAAEVMAYGNGIVSSSQDLSVDDCIVAIIRFDSGCVAKTLTSMAASRPGMRNVQIHGSKKTVVTSLQSGGHLISDMGERQWEELEASEEGVDTRQVLTSDFLDAIAEGREPIVNLEQSLRTASICVAAFESLLTGKPVSVPKF